LGAPHCTMCAFFGHFGHVNIANLPVTSAGVCSNREWEADEKDSNIWYLIGQKLDRHISECIKSPYGPCGTFFGKLKA